MKLSGCVTWRKRQLIKVILIGSFFIVTTLLCTASNDSVYYSSYYHLHWGIEKFYHDKDCVGNRGMQEAKEATRSLLSSGIHSNNSIPLIVHQMYRDKQIPGDYVPHLLTVLRYLNGESHLHERVKTTQQKAANGSLQQIAFRYAFWTDTTMKRFVHSEFAEYASLYDSYSHSLERADVARYFILLRFGGIYIDMDMELRRPLHDLLAANRYGCVLAQDLPLMVTYLWRRTRSVTNSFIACKPNSTLMRRTVESLHLSAASVSYHPDSIVYRTGPFLLDAVVRTMLYESIVHPPELVSGLIKKSGQSKSKKSSASQYDFLIAPPSWFSGVIDSKHFHDVRKTCIATLRKSQSGVHRLIERVGLTLSLSSAFERQVENSVYLRRACMEFWREASNAIVCDTRISQMDPEERTKYYMNDKELQSRCAELFEQTSSPSMFAGPYSFGIHHFLNIGYFNGSLPYSGKLVDVETFLRHYGINYYFPYS